MFMYYINPLADSHGLYFMLENLVELRENLPVECFVLFVCFFFNQPASNCFSTKLHGSCYKNVSSYVHFVTNYVNITS